ncbi:MAG: tetratricopeptide repeat protein [Gemmatimonas sp.]
MSWWKRLMGGASGDESSRPANYLAEALELEKRGDYSNALTSYRLALRENPEDLQVLQNMAIAFSRTSQPEEAIRAYRKALQVDPELAGAHYGLAFLLLKRGYTAPAAVHLEGFLRNSTGTDEQSVKFRAHAEQTLRNIEAMGEPAPAQSDEMHDTHTHDAQSSDHMNRPES